MLKFFRTLVITLTILPTMAHAALFSTAGVVSGSDSFNVTVNGVTMTIDNPSPYPLSNYTGNELDFGFSPVSWVTNLLSFDVSFDKDVSVSGFYDIWDFQYLIPAAIPTFSISGPGVNALITSAVVGYNDFTSGPFEFLSNQKYTFSATANFFEFGGLEATAVPTPSAALLFGSSLLGFMGLRRRK